MPFTNHSNYQENFPELNLTDETLKDHEFEDCKFTDCFFINCKLEKCRFINCQFISCQITGTSLTDSRFIDVSFASCKIMGLDWTITHQLQDTTFKNCQLNYSNFKLMKLPKIKMLSCQIKESDFYRNRPLQLRLHWFRLGKNHLFQNDFNQSQFLPPRSPYPPIWSGRHFD